MIAIQKIGKSFIGALKYNLRKMEYPETKGRAELLDTNFTNLDLNRIKSEVDLMRGLRPNLSRYVYHTSLNFSKEEEAKLTNDMLVDISHDYLEGLGFTDNQYFVFRHYDADHPHVHLLVNRIAFDGTVVSDSNNYKKSEAILRRLEEQYNLIAVEQSSYAAQRAPKKDELEMAIRTGVPSEKMLLQEILKPLISKPGISLQTFIKHAEAAGVYLLFNQASTGRITGITYFHDDFMIKGQALGNRFKWAELIKKVNYEQDRDGKAISEANRRTRAIYGELSTGRPGAYERGGQRGAGLPAEASRDLPNDGKQSANVGGIKNEGNTGRERPLETDQDANMVDNGTARDEYHRFVDAIRIEISDDIDDEAILGRNRRRKGMARTNTR
ncbi:relaxase/mobilization nuclease domain-containing protein [Mucilaginibacter flavidus]|uniref:relaxase/mobilization nuclease domain-containing protein n=1 Tax=Mucilaginibacter flavidus TaxID=2949309 RepID=UPI0020931103|nr:relaxase/mobilization nuclease domain-containing protein [Mucilaginibacter flavidus]MCO5950467.1 relaxase/mobilization nuclease domain-containing protein [Mucilaginibacter flavidus]